MITGIGTDIVNIARIKRIYTRYGTRFVNKTLSSKEKDIFNTLSEIQKPHYLAKRFAAKEATAKALGTGFGKALGFREIEVTNNSKGKPILTLLGKGAHLENNLSIKAKSISISDESDYALAFVVLES